MTDDAMQRSVSMLIHGPSKAGKSTLAATAPGPRLLLDAEHGHKFLPIKIRYWEPHDEPPVVDGTWDTVVVVVRKYDDVLNVYRWLQSGQHPFKSLIMDSISEIQAKCLEQIAGREQVKTQQWGDLLRHMTGLMRDIRDLTVHPTNPLTAVVITAMTTQKDGKYITTETFQHPDPTQGDYTVRRLYVGPHDDYVSGERVGHRLGDIVEQSDLNVEIMLDRIYNTQGD